MHKTISQTQVSLLDKSRIFLRKKDASSARRNVTDPENYLNVWAPGSLGSLRVECLNQSQWISKDFIIARIRDIIGLGREGEISLDAVDPHFKYERIVISWCAQSDFLEDGSVRSRYFNCATNDYKNTLWVMIPLDGFVPQHKKENVSFLNRNGSNTFSFVRFFKNLFFCLFKGISVSSEGLFAQKFSDEIIKKLDIQQAKSFLLPYEGQPWQHTVYLRVKESNRDIKTLGDLHSCLPPLPTDFIKRCGAPDIFFLHGAGQKKIALQSLGWRDGEVKVVPSLRFGKGNSVDIGNKILLPYNFQDTDFILNQIESFFQNFGTEAPHLEIRNHPAQTASPHHMALISGIQKLQNTYESQKNRDMTDQKVVFVIGASSAIIECLEHGMTVFQVTEDPVFESYSPDIWQGLDVEYMSDHIIRYSLRGNPSFLEFGTSDIQMMFNHE